MYWIKNDLDRFILMVDDTSVRLFKERIETKDCNNK